MRPLLVLLFALLPIPARAEVVVVSVAERGESAALRFEIDTASAISSSSASPGGEPLPTIDGYLVRGGRLIRASTNTTIGTAVELLGQVRVSAGDLVIVRQEHNSLSNPLHWLSALTGHPVQVSRITWFLVLNGGGVRSGSLLRRAASYRWSVRLFEKRD